ncbi:MAG: DUF1003 domain-containing protein [Firmicutes bacterium]|nr:DUF1003 domain-containing protein [Bacillota bacterium]
MDNKNTKKDIVKMLIAQDLNDKDEEDLMELLIDEQIAVNVEKEEESKMTRGDRVADKLSEIAGSWTFIIGFTVFLLFWIILNGVILTKAVDPYPFILLNLLLSCLAALQAPIIMMSQNRQAKKDTLRNKNDYKTDLKSELILEDLHDDIQKLIKNQNKIIKYIEENEKKGNK